MKSFPHIPLVLVALGCSTPAPGPKLTSVEPPRVSTFLPTPISIRGETIEYAVTADFDRPSSSSFALDLHVRLIGPQTLELPTAERPSTTEVTASVPPGLMIGRYTIEVSTARGVDRLTNALEVANCFDCEAPLDGGCFSWPDVDRDGYGARGQGKAVCADDAGVRVSRGGDCRDLDPLAHADAVELCNSLDDDCDGVVDDGACAPDAGWRARTDTGGAGFDWTTATNYGRGKVWLAEKQQVYLRPGAGAFSVVSACSNKLISSWADPAQSSSGLAYFGGQGVLTSHTAGSTGCANSITVGGEVVGLQGFASATGPARVFGALSDGRLIEGQGTLFNTRAGFPGGARVKDVQGATRTSLFAVGLAGTRPNVWRMATDGGAFVDERVDLLPVPDQSLNAVWVVDESLAYAVGSAGALIERLDGGWTAIATADAGLSAVRAFGRGRVYAATVDGRVLRFDGARWEQLYANPLGTPFTDLTGSAEDDLWVVGNDGLVVHWSE